MAEELPSELPLIVSRSGPVTTFRLNRPERLNAITPDMHHLLQDAFDAFAADDEQRIGVVTGTGRAFCAGSDVKAMSDRGRRGGGSVDLPSGGYGGLAQRFDLDKPLIAAVNGLAIGGGFEIALCCDLIVAASSARFALPEPHVGYVAIGGGPHRLVAEIGPKRSMDVVLTGRQIAADEALAMGFVNEVVPDDALGGAVSRWCTAILRGGPLAIRASKALVRASANAPDLPLAMLGQNALPSLQRWRDSDETVEGPRAFAEKRLPRWQPE